MTWAKHAPRSVLRLRPRARKILEGVAERERKKGRSAALSIICEQLCEWGAAEYERKGLIPLSLPGAAKRRPRVSGPPRLHEDGEIRRS